MSVKLQIESFLYFLLLFAKLIKSKKKKKTTR